MTADELVSIRPAALSEQAVLKSMIRAGRLNPLGLDWRRFLVAVSDSGEIRGCIQCKDHGGDVRELASLYVWPAWRGKGIAGQLIHSLMRRTSLPLWLTCRSRLTGFYAGFGFSVIENSSEMPLYFRLARQLFRIVRLFLPGGEGLAVMCCLEPIDSTGWPE